jgi:hypothetical protein
MRWLLESASDKRAFWNMLFVNTTEANVNCGFQAFSIKAKAARTARARRPQAHLNFKFTVNGLIDRISTVCNREAYVFEPQIHRR